MRNSNSPPSYQGGAQPQQAQQPPMQGPAPPPQQMQMPQQGMAGLGQGMRAMYDRMHGDGQQMPQGGPPQGMQMPQGGPRPPMPGGPPPGGPQMQGPPPGGPPSTAAPISPEGFAAYRKLGAMPISGKGTTREYNAAAQQYAQQYGSGYDPSGALARTKALRKQYGGRKNG